MTNEEPLYKHNCDCCVYLGQHTSEEWGEGDVDLYYHGKRRSKVIYRFSNEENEYGIMGVVDAAFCTDNSSFKEASDRAVKLGLTSDADNQEIQRYCVT